VLSILCTLILTVLAPTSSHASETPILGYEWTFLKALAQADMPAKAKFESTFYACYDMTNSYYEQKNGFLGAVTKGLNYMTKPMTYTSALLMGVGGSPVQDNYAKSLEEINPIQDPLLRIQKVYELAIAHQGPYDYYGWAPYASLPSTVIEDGAKGQGAQCRDFVLLLYWSLQQVAVHPSDKNHLALSEKSFSVETVFGHGRATSGRRKFHEWVRIHLPTKNKRTGVMTFTIFDLDTTVYNKQYVPLMARKYKSNKIKVETTIQSCSHFMACLQKKASAYQTESTIPKELWKNGFPLECLKEIQP